MSNDDLNNFKFKINTIEKRNNNIEKLLKNENTRFSKNIKEKI